MKQPTYTEELALLAAELQKDDPTLSTAEAIKQAREQMLELYQVALEWNRAAVAQRSITVISA